MADDMTDVLLDDIAEFRTRLAESQEQLADAISRLERWAALGRQGVLVSVAYGPSLRGGLGWTVVALQFRTEVRFETPFEARDLPHAIDIAEREAVKRGWLKL